MPTTTSLPTAGSHLIDVPTAIAMTTRYRNNRENILDISMQGQDILPLSETFNRTDIDVLLAVPGCEGLRIYPGMDTDMRVHMIIVAVNEGNEDLLTVENSSEESEDGPVVEVGQRCPTLCPPASDLNS